ncbi:MAG: DMT family transporter [Paracoccaceae bacterium]
MDMKALAMGVAFALMWSSAFTSARIIVVDAPPLTALAVRFLISGVLAVAVARALGQSWALSPAQWRATALFGLCQNALYLGLYFVAMQTVEASLAAIVASTLPLLVALSGWAVRGERIRPLGAAGLVAGMGGVALIMGTRIGGGAVDPIGLGLCVAGVLALTVATLSMRTASSGGNLLMIVGLQMLVGATALAAVGLATEPLEVRWTWTLAAAFVYTTLVPGLAATFVWFLLVERVGAVRAATFHFLNPFLGVAIAALVLGERIGALDALGVAVIAAGILAVQLSKTAGPRPAASAP